MVRAPQNFATQRGSNVEILLKHNNTKPVIHANRLKLYFVANKNLAVCPDFLQPLPPSQIFPGNINPPPCQKTTHLCSVLYWPTSGRSEFLNLLLSFTPRHKTQDAHNGSLAHLLLLHGRLLTLTPQNYNRQCTPRHAHVRSHSFQLVVTFHCLCPRLHFNRYVFCKRGRDWKTMKLKMTLTTVLQSTSLM
jgi:hypothetical protein